MTIAIHLTPYRLSRLAIYAERDAAIEALLRAAPAGLTTGQLTALTGLGYEALQHALNRLEAHGPGPLYLAVTLCFLYHLSSLLWVTVARLVLVALAGPLLLGVGRCV